MRLHGITADMRSTGIRSIKALLAGVVFAGPTWEWLLIREGIRITMTGTFRVSTAANQAGKGNGLSLDYTLPAGFAPSSPLYLPVQSAATGVDGVLYVEGGQHMTVAAPNTSSAFTFSHTWITNAPMPAVSALPGTQITPPNYT